MNSALTSAGGHKDDEAYQLYVLSTCPDGRIQGWCRTNDNLDRGIPTEYAEWEVTYRDQAHMTQSTGLTHVGISGVRVEVRLDGHCL